MKDASLLKQVRAVAALPGAATLAIPAVIVWLTGSVNVGWRLQNAAALLPPLAGCVIIGTGLALMVQTITLLSNVGHGTLAPWNPTQKLVVRGIYRHVRNPMISGVFFVLLGEAVVLGSVPLLYWFLLFAVLNAIYMPLSEEPGLAKRFGEEYAQYKKNVPRWIPRLKPWVAPFDHVDNGDAG